MADAEEEYQVYDIDENEVKVDTVNAGTTQSFVYLGDSTTYPAGTKSNQSITNKTNWDTSKILRLPAKNPYSVRLTSTDLVSQGAFLKQITVTMKAGSYQDTETIAAGTTPTTATTLTFAAGGLEGNLKIGKPSVAAYDSINYNKNDVFDTDFLKVTNQSLFTTVMSPVVFEITVGTGESAYTSEIKVKFDDSTHTSSSTDPTQSSVSYESVENQSGYSVLDVSVDSTYAGTDNYLLTIAKYEGSIVYNSYMKVPATTSDKVRLAFSSDGLQQVIIEIVSSNDAYGDSVPGYLAYCYYEPNKS